MNIINAAVKRLADKVGLITKKKETLSKLTEGYLRRYPVRSFGIPVVEVEDILLSYKLEVTKLIPAAAMRIESKKPDEPCFNNLYRETIQNLAGYVHLLPASEYHHHHELGGLFYHSLQTAHGCLEKARSKEGKIPREKETLNVDAFQEIKPKWIYGAWVLGLIHDIGKVLLDIDVYEHGNEKNIWNPLNESLVEWAERTGVSSYETKMSKNRKHGSHEEIGALLVKEIVSRQGLDFIRQGGPDLMRQIFQYMSGKYTDGTFLHQVVKHVDGMETARDINMRWDKHLGESRVNVEKIFISSARSLLPTFKVNEPKGKVFIVGGRAFMTVAAIDRIIAFAKQENYRHFPQSTKEFCESLMETGVIEPIRDQNGEATDEWFGVLKPSIGNDYRVIKLKSPIVIYWEGDTPTSLSGEYVMGNTGIKEVYTLDGEMNVQAEGQGDVTNGNEASSEAMTGEQEHDYDDSDEGCEETGDDEHEDSEVEGEDEQGDREIEPPTVSYPSLTDEGSAKKPVAPPSLEVADMGEVNTDDNGEFKEESVKPNQQNKQKPKRKKRKKSQFEASLAEYLTDGLYKKMSDGDVVYIDKTFALSMTAIAQVANKEYMQALPYLKSKNLINDERGVRKISVDGEDKVMVVINNDAVSKIIDEKGIDVVSIALTDQVEGKVKDKDNWTSDLIAKAEVSEHKEDYESQVIALVGKLDAVIEDEDGVYVEYAGMTRVSRKVSEENRGLLQAEIVKGHQKDVEDKVYVRILERSNG